MSKTMDEVDATKAVVRTLYIPTITIESGE